MPGGPSAPGVTGLTGVAGLTSVTGATGTTDVTGVTSCGTVSAPAVAVLHAAAPDMAGAIARAAKASHSGAAAMAVAGVAIARIMPATVALMTARHGRSIAVIVRDVWRLCWRHA
jgi:hypothetical protein